MRAARTLPTLLGVTVLLVWQAGVSAWDIPAYVLPSPLRVLQTLLADAAVLLPALAFTLHITLWAFLSSTLAGLALAGLLARSRLLEATFMPYAVLLQVTPVVSIAPLIIIWVKDAGTAMVVCAALMAVFPVLSSATQGLRSTDPDLLAWFRLQGASHWQVLWHLRLPGALPYVLAGLRISAGMSLIGAVVAEFVAGTGGTATGLAYQILQAGYQLDIPRMFAALTLIGGSGLALHACMGALARRLIGHWHASEYAAPAAPSRS